MHAVTLEPSWVGSPLSIIPSLDDDDKEAKMSLLPPTHAFAPPPQMGGRCSPADSDSDLGRTPFRSRWVPPLPRPVPAFSSVAKGLDLGPLVASPPTGTQRPWAAGRRSQ